MGKIFLYSGVVHGLLMAYASCLAIGLIRWKPDDLEWFTICALHLFGTSVAGGGYIAKTQSEADIPTHQLVLDLIAGMAVFFFLFASVVWMLAKWLPVRASWVSLGTSGWLIYYGFALFRGRQVWDRLDL